MSDYTNGPEIGNEAKDAQAADSRLLFARILERLDRLEKKLDSALSQNRPRQWNNENRRPGGASFNRPFKSNGFSGGHRSGGQGRFDGPRRPHQGHGKPFGHSPQSPR